MDVAAPDLTAAAWGWASFGASLAAIVATCIGMGQLMRRQRRRRPPPTPPPAGATLDDWDDYAIRVDQWAKDLE